MYNLINIYMKTCNFFHSHCAKKFSRKHHLATVDNLELAGQPMSFSLTETFIFIRQLYSIQKEGQTEN